MGQPIRGMTRPLPVKASIIPAVIPPEVVTLDANFNASIHNRFDGEVIDAQTGKLKQRAQAENVICAKTWTHLNDAWFNYIHYGSRSGTPSSSDTSLFTFVSAVSASAYSANRDTTNNVYSVVKKITLSETTSVGVTITEVGIGADTTATSLCTHAMLKDGNGNQISIAKTNTDIINIYASVFVHYTASDTLTFNDVLLSLVAGSTSYWFNTDARIRYYTRTSIGGNMYQVAKISSATINSTSKTITIVSPRLGAGAANAHGIHKIVVGTEVYDGGYKYLDALEINVSKIRSCSSDVTGEAIGTGDGSTKDFATYFTDATNATIFVDGVEATGVTVDNVSTVTNNIHFAVAPASGSVITANYHTAVVAKDTNHVFDLTVTIQLGEYTS